MKKLGSPLLRNTTEGKVVVIKLGGKVLTEEKKKNHLLKQIVELSKKMSVVVVHGGGPEITKTLEKSGIKTKFIDGLRYTGKKMMPRISEVLEKINNDLVRRINLVGGKAVGLSGEVGNFFLAKRIKRVGLVGEPKSVDTNLLKLFLKNRIIPVVSSLGTDGKGVILNINADAFSSALALALKAKKLLFLTDAPGVIGKNGKLISTVHRKEIPKLIKNKIVLGGMIPKLKSSLQATKKNVRTVIITNGEKGLDSGTEIVQ